MSVAVSSSRIICSLVQLGAITSVDQLSGERAFRTLVTCIQLSLCQPAGAAINPGQSRKSYPSGRRTEVPSREREESSIDRNPNRSRVGNGLAPELQFAACEVIVVHGERSRVRVVFF